MENNQVKDEDDKMKEEQQTLLGKEEEETPSNKRTKKMTEVEETEQALIKLFANRSYVRWEEYDLRLMGCPVELSKEFAFFLADHGLTTLGSLRGLTTESIGLITKKSTKEFLFASVLRFYVHSYRLYQQESLHRLYQVEGGNMMAF